MFEPASVQMQLEERWELQLGLAQQQERQQPDSEQGEKVGLLLPFAGPLPRPDRVRLFSIQFDV
jgi:hypothetical protein